MEKKKLKAWKMTFCPGGGGGTSYNGLYKEAPTERGTFSRLLAPVVQKVDNAIHRVNLYPLDNAIGFRNTCSLDSDLSGGERYPSFEQPGPA